jgi:hypothetical protein
MAKKEEAYVLDEATGKYVLNPKFKAEEVAAPAKPAKAAKAKK